MFLQENDKLRFFLEKINRRPKIYTTASCTKYQLCTCSAKNVSHSGLVHHSQNCAPRNPDDKIFRIIDTAAALCFFPGRHHRLTALLHQVRGFHDRDDGGDGDDDDHDGGGVDVGTVQ